jgi:LysR family nitrogen assimilation transcriptional regulator
MELIQLHYFVRAVDSGGLTQAGLQLNVTQPTLSRQIAQLESEFGQRLLVRTGRGVKVTEAGAGLLRYAREILALAARAKDELGDLQSSPSGRITVGVPPRIAALIAVPLVEKFRERFPRAVITVAEGLSHHLRELLSTGRLDVALLFDPAPSPQLGYVPLATESLFLVMPPSYPAHPEAVRFKDLATWPLILPSSPNAIRLLLDAAARSANIELQVVAEVDAVRSMQALVLRGAGCSILPESAITPEMVAQRVHVVPITSPSIKNRIVLATSNLGPSTRLLRETSDILRNLPMGSIAPRNRRNSAKRG